MFALKYIAVIFDAVFNDFLIISTFDNNFNSERFCNRYNTFKNEKKILICCIDIIVIDPENEYKELCEAVG